MKLIYFLILSIISPIYSSGFFKDWRFSETYQCNNFIELIKSGSYKQVKDLVNEGFNVNCKNQNNITPLIVASRINSLKTVELLLKLKADPNIKGGIGDVTPLIEASYNGNEDMVRLLIENGANVNARVATGYTPLIVASNMGYIDIVRLLLDYGAEVNIKDSQGDSVLSNVLQHMVFVAPDVRKEYRKILNILIKARADSFEVFEKVIKTHNINGIKELLRAGASISQNSLGEKAIEMANEYGQHDIATLLTELRDIENNIEKVDVKSLDLNTIIMLIERALSLNTPKYYSLVVEVVSRLSDEQINSIFDLFFVDTLIDYYRSTKDYSSYVKNILKIVKERSKNKILINKINKTLETAKALKQVLKIKGFSDIDIVT